jgi:hypothetical protein
MHDETCKRTSCHLLVSRRRNIELPAEVFYCSVFTDELDQTVAMEPFEYSDLQYYDCALNML